jgi:hypothetical protein
MIIFDLKCAPRGHVFEAWFASSAAFDEQRSGGLVACPLCGSSEIAKAPMAPAVGPRSQSSEPGSGEARAALAAVAELQRRLLEGSEGVGTRFADEARAIHLGEAEARVIHGEATMAQAESLLDEGIAIAPLPFPVVPPGEEN